MYLRVPWAQKIFYSQRKFKVLKSGSFIQLIYYVPDPGTRITIIKSVI